MLVAKKHARMLERIARQMGVPCDSDRGLPPCLLQSRDATHLPHRAGSGSGASGMADDRAMRESRAGAAEPRFFARGLSWQRAARDPARVDWNSSVVRCTSTCAGSMECWGPAAGAAATGREWRGGYGGSSRRRSIRRWPCRRRPRRTRARRRRSQRVGAAFFPGEGPLLIHETLCVF
jgi:hypothetical protein